MFDIDEESKKKVYEAFGRTEKSVDEDVKTLSNWLKNQPHLPELMEDVKIRNFLSLNKFSVEKTKQKIDMYYTIRSLIPELFVDCNPTRENLQRAFDSMYMTVHPKAFDGIHRIWFFRIKGPNMYPCEESLKIFLCIHEIRLYEDFLCNDILVYDFSHFTLNDMTKLTPSLLAKAAAVYQKVFSFRLKAIHYLNSPPYVSIALSALKLVMKPKIFGRIRVHQDTKILSELFTKDELPKDYGGNGPSLEELNERMKQKILEYKERFDVLDTLRVNEELRPEPLDNDEILGYYGNFKKLDVD